jgi:hypothetical protein
VVKLCAQREAGILGLKTKVPAPQAVVQDMHKFLSCIDEVVEVKEFINGTETYLLCTDACRSNSFAGFGAALFSSTSGKVDFFNGLFEQQVRELHINMLEALALLYAVKHYLPLLSRARGVIIAVDNQTLSFSLRKGRSRSEELDNFVQQIVDELENITYTVWWIESDQNPADNLSRQREFVPEDLQRGFKLLNGR